MGQGIHLHPSAWRRSPAENSALSPLRPLAMTGMPSPPAAGKQLLLDRYVNGCHGIHACTSGNASRKPIGA